MAKGKKKSVKQYDHVGKPGRNNPPAGLVTSESDYEGESEVYGYGWSNRFIARDSSR